MRTSTRVRSSLILLVVSGIIGSLMLRSEKHVSVDSRDDRNKVLFWHVESDVDARIHISLTSSIEGTSSYNFVKKKSVGSVKLIQGETMDISVSAEITGSAADTIEMKCVVRTPESVIDIEQRTITRHVPFHGVYCSGTVKVA